MGLLDELVRSAQPFPRAGTDESPHREGHGEPHRRADPSAARRTRDEGRTVRRAGTHDAQRLRREQRRRGQESEAFFGPRQGRRIAIRATTIISASTANWSQVISRLRSESRIWIAAREAINWSASTNAGRHGDPGASTA